MIGLTIPTRGDHPDLLEDVVRTSGLPPERVVVVWTGPAVDAPTDLAATLIQDDGPVNIHRWWNVGIEALVAAGCDHVAVLNDDVVINEATLPRLGAALDAGATLAAPSRGRMTGWCWALSAAHGVRPDEGYRWWFGDNQLFLDAQRAHGVAFVPAAYCHHVHGNSTTEASAELQSLAQQDQIRFQEVNGG